MSDNESVDDQRENVLDNVQQSLLNGEWAVLAIKAKAAMGACWRWIRKFFFACFEDTCWSATVWRRKNREGLQRQSNSGVPRRIVGEVGLWPADYHLQFHLQPLLLPHHLLLPPLHSLRHRKIPVCHHRPGLHLFFFGFFFFNFFQGFFFFFFCGTATWCAI